MARRAGVWVALVVALAAGCSTAEPPPSGESAPPATPTASAPRTPGPVPQDQRFTFEDVAEFPDGLAIEMAGSLATEAQPKDKGAEATGGEMVVVSIVIQNNTEAEFDATNVVVGATYSNGKAATKIEDSTSELQPGFAGSIPVGEEGTATLGFAVPFSATDEVTFVVDPGDGKHEAVSFTGTVIPG